VLYGGPGTDDLEDGAGDDVLYGGDGVDVFYTGRGEDVLYGGDGSDVLYDDDGQRDKLYCGEGRDSYWADKLDYVDSSCEKKSLLPGNPEA
jgi:Ca2+-binding RTX toxin-like protein